MNMRKKLNSISIIWLFVVTAFLSCKNEQRLDNHQNHLQEHGAYICPMRCEGEKTYPQPGNCPVCDMKLEILEEELVQTIAPNKQVLSNQTTVKLQSGSLDEKMTAQGFVVPAQNRNQSVAVRFSGRIEKLYVKYSNQYIKQGDKVLDIYSPDLRTFQEEHLFLLKSNVENNLLEKSREKLQLLGISKTQITLLEEKGKVAMTVTVFSPASGYIFFDSPSTQKKSVQNNSTTNAMNMQQNTNNESSYAATATQIREGMYVNEGQTLFSVNDLQEVWAMVSVSSQYVNQVYKNQSVDIISESNPQKINAKVSFIELTFEEANQRFVRIRIVLPNARNLLKINSLVTAQFISSDIKNVQVPASAVYKTGLNAYVWVKTDTTRSGTGIFQLRKVLAGASHNGMTIIKSGFSSDEEIALHAGLMTDSETFLNIN